MSDMLRSLLCAGLAASASAADQVPGVERELRQQESAQKTVANQAATAARQLDELADEYASNRIGDPRQAQTLGGIARSLQELTDPAAGSGDRTMPWVQARLAAARTGSDQQAELSKAASGQGEILGRIDGMLRDARSIGGRSRKLGIDELQVEQKRLLDATAKLADTTLGKSELELSLAEKVEQNRIDEQQRHLEDELKRSLEKLAEDARDEAKLDPDQAKLEEQVAKDLAQDGIDQDMRRAADAVKGNQLDDAQQAQQEVLDKLQKAQQQLGPLVEEAPTLSDFDQKYKALAELGRRQQELHDVTEKLPAASTAEVFAQLQSQQRELAIDIKDNADARIAAPDADLAAQQLGASAPKPAIDDMQKVLDAIRRAKEVLAARGGPIGWCPADPGGSPDGTVPAMMALQEGGLAKKEGKAAWKIELPPEARDTLTESAAEKFPSQYERDLVRYYRDLATVGGATAPADGKP
jgi:hypothetical protein